METVYSVRSAIVNIAHTSASVYIIHNLWRALTGRVKMNWNNDDSE